MFCSATPAFTYWLGNCSMKPVSAPKPRSPLTSMMRSSSAASSLRARTKASRIMRHRHVNAELTHRRDIFLASRRAVMPQHVILHEGDSATLDGVGDDAGRPVIGTLGEGGAKGIMIMAVDTERVPSERAPLRAERFEIDRIGHAAERLQLVVVDNRAEIGEAMMAGEHRRFPDRALVAFAVAENREHALAAAEPPQVERHSGSNAEAVAERAGGDFYSGHALVADVTREGRAVAIVRVERLDVEESPFGKRRVDAGSGMALGEDEAVALGPVRTGWVDVEDLTVEHGDNVGDRQARGDMRATAAAAHADDMAPQLECELLGVAHSKKSRTASMTASTCSSLSR